ncbi:Succinate-semialdehyde dehydrogenase [NADP(+)] 1 [Acaryochloris thomasi RCC1774]|uniref:Succinate-semialdehyde dehydrogenase [NADP(+)] 1 n=1 Tax=Acaryochloris thomasi RCC1774 TaxID=1764569 RepID=A0A2W1JCT7_9CYAN|nr:NAD-dependent succinate-semialdehyde dehydrogenase [Acaryochloris thomasi]PZD71616.1 Succinate-semialdehyde dehydrogenase [NADP(+)] 1 [Acaryochloris thomasi RCC1774]
MGIATINPATGETVKTFDALSAEQVQTKIARADQAFASYQQTTMADRSQWLTQAAELLEDPNNSRSYAKLMTLEMGKPLQEAISEVKKCASVCRYYAENAADFLANQYTQTDASQSFISYQPLGIVLAVMPWNFPFWQVFRFAAPALMAGNVGLLKHASNVPQCALAIEDILSRAGFPDGVFQTLLIGAAQVESVVKDTRVKAATLTGSEPAGASLAAVAGTQIKKTVLELGGSDPFIILESADLNLAAETAVKARMLNNGQSCIAAKRFIVVDAIADEFEQKLVAAFNDLTIGDPMDETVHVGPLATASILSELDQQVLTAVQNGARVLIGGNKKAEPGNYYLPTILTDIAPDNPVYYEEFFGPVALLFRIPDLDAAIKLANDTPFGLGASAWTAIPEEQERCIVELEAGAVFINGMVKSDPRLPFGGIKRSGYGRELGIPGIHEFVNLKTIWIK